jgi:hypothetical protein
MLEKLIYLIKKIFDLKIFLFFFIRKINIYFLTKKNNRIIFYQTHRSSGTSLKFFFQKYFGKEVFYKTPSNFLPIKNVDKKIKIIQGHCAYQALEKFKNDYEFTILRDPIDTLISIYFKSLNFNISKENKTTSVNVIQKKKLNISQFVDLHKKYYYDNMLTRMFANKYFYVYIHNSPLKIRDIYQPNLRNEDVEFAIKNLKNINVFIYEKLNRLELIKSFGTKIFFDDLLIKNKSHKNFIPNEKDIRELQSISKYDQKIYDYFLLNK